MKIIEYSKAEPAQGPQETRTEGQVCLYKTKPHCPGHLYTHKGDMSKLPPEPEETVTQWPPAPGQVLAAEWQGRTSPFPSTPAHTCFPRAARTLILKPLAHGPITTQWWLRGQSLEEYSVISTWNDDTEDQEHPGDHWNTNSTGEISVSHLGGRKEHREAAAAHKHWKIGLGMMQNTKWSNGILALNQRAHRKPWHKDVIYIFLRSCYFF